MLYSPESTYTEDVSPEGSRVNRNSRGQAMENGLDRVDTVRVAAARQDIPW